MALLIESARAEASLRSLLVEFPLASDLGKATVVINNDDIFRLKNRPTGNNILYRDNM
jgi:hypothetical protein